MKSRPSKLAHMLCRFLLGCLLMATLAVGASGEELDQSRDRLTEIQSQIDETLKGLRSKRVASGALADELARLDSETRRIEKLTRTSSRQMSKLSDQLKKQRQALHELEQQQQQTEAQVSQRLVVLYKSGEVGLIRALLSEAETPREIAEKYAFLTRMVRHDRELLTQYRQQAVEHEAAVVEIEQLQKKQSSLVKRRLREQETLKTAQKSKKNLMAALHRDETLMEGMLQQLRAKALRLNTLVKKLETEQTQTYTETLVGLSAEKGRLPWPVSGKIMVTFGKSRHGDLGTLIESHGIEIEAAVGTSVKVVAPGKVLYANSLRGYGKLLIVDHGGKDYSLYAHMNQFTKQVGDMVASGETIAYSGSENRDSIYFEIRHGGKPLDPKPWLKPR